MNDILKAVVLGCGRIGASASHYPSGLGITSHAAAYALCTQTKLVGVCDKDQDVARLSAKRHGAERWTVNIEELLSFDPDIVSICAGVEVQTDVFEMIASHPTVRGILIEKPVANDLAAGHRMSAIAKKYDVSVVVNYSRRFSPRLRAVASWLRESGIGQIRFVSGHYTKNLIHNGTHWIDLARMMVGEISGVEGCGSPISRLQDEGTIDVYFKFENGSRGFLAGHEEECFTIFDMEIVGTKGRLYLTDLGRSFELHSAADSLRHPGYRELILADRAVNELTNDVLLYAVENLVSCVRGEQRPFCNIEDGLRALELAECALNNRKVLKLI